MKRNSEVVQDDEGKRIVVIHNIQFKGRQNIDWDSVENYIRRYIGFSRRIFGFKIYRKIEGGFCKSESKCSPRIARND